MKKMSKVEVLEGRAFSTESVGIIYREENVKRIALVKIDNREFTEYKLNNGGSDSYLYIRNTAQYTFWELSLDRLGEETSVLKEEIEEAPKAERIADLLRDKISFSWNQDLENASYIELEDEESAYMGFKKGELVFLPNSFYNPTEAHVVALNDIKDFIAHETQLDDWRISKSHDITLGTDTIEIEGRLKETSEEHIHARYLRGDNIVYEINPNNIYEVKVLNTEYNELFLYRKTTVQEGDVCKYEKYIPNKKTSGITDEITGPFSFFKY